MVEVVILKLTYAVINIQEEFLTLYFISFIPRGSRRRYLLDRMLNIVCFSIPVTSRGGPLGCETLRLPHFLDSRLTYGSAGCPLRPGRFLVLISVKGLSRPQHHSADGLSK
jgi:hypothetical protein